MTQLAAPTKAVRGASLARALCAPIGGVLLALSGPPFPVAFLPCALVGLALFEAALDAPGSRWRALGRGVSFGFAVNLVVFVFVVGTIRTFTDLPLVAAVVAWILLAAAQGLAFGWLALVRDQARRFGVPAPLSFALGVAALPLFPTVFSWTIAVPLARAPLLAQPAEWVGERGLTIVLALLAAATVRAFFDRRRRSRWVASTVAIAAALIAVSAWRAHAIEVARSAAPKQRMGLVQHAEPPKDRWDPNEGPRILQRLWALSRQAEHDGARITVWPEAAYPFVVGHHAMRDGAEGPRVRGPGIRGEIITGLLTVAGHTASGGTDMFNAALIAHDGGSIDAPTAKMALLAFGEAVPFGEQVPWLRDTFARAGAMRPGAAPVVLTSSQSPVVVAGVLNCFEDTLPNQTRAVMAGRPNLLVNLTNDAWFGDSAEPELHLAAATMRAIESRRDMVRAVNTGVTAHLDALGQVAARANRGERTTLVVDVALLEGTTLFDRFGDASWLAPLLVASLAAAWRARRRSPDEA